MRSPLWIGTCSVVYALWRRQCMIKLEVSYANILEDYQVELLLGQDKV
jgi:hypothetical protein